MSGGQAMRGYKMVSNEYKSYYGNMKYEIGEVYEIDKNKELILDEYGFHYCESIEDALVYNSFENKFRLLEVDNLDSETYNKYGKCCSRKIQVIREITKDEVEKYVYKNIDFSNRGYYNYYNLHIIIAGLCLDMFISHKNWILRSAVARNGYGLDILVNDESEFVRMEVAKHGYGLDVLVNDESAVLSPGIISSLPHFS